MTHSSRIPSTFRAASARLLTTYKGNSLPRPACAYVLVRTSMCVRMCMRMHGLLLQNSPFKFAWVVRQTTDVCDMPVRYYGAI